MSGQVGAAVGHDDDWNESPPVAAVVYPSASNSGLV